MNELSGNRNNLLEINYFPTVTKPPFLFGDSVQMYNDDPEAIYAVIAMVLASVFLQANVYVTLRMLKGMQFTLVIVLHFFNLVSKTSRP